MRACGAFDTHEALIEQETQRAFDALASADLPSAAAAGLRQAGTAAVTRKF
jgi:hypothetical protein